MHIIVGKQQLHVLTYIMLKVVMCYLSLNRLLKMGIKQETLSKIKKDNF